MDKLNIFFRLTKVDVAKRTVEGIATAELPDQSGEICDYASTKPYYQKWSDGIKKASGGKSLGNVRAMHSNIAAGKVVDLNFDDADKAIRITAKIVDDAEWNKVVEGVYTGFSQGGEYVRKWQDADSEHTRYTANPIEVSIVDSPCLSAATFEVVKADGAVEMRKFHVEPVADKTPVQKWETTDGKTFEKKNDAIEHQAKLDADEFADQVVGRIKKTVDAANEALDKHDAVEPEVVAEAVVTEPVIEKAADEPVAAAEPELAKAEEADHMDHIHGIHKDASHIMNHAMKCMGKDMEMFVKAVGEEMADHIAKIHKKAGAICGKCMKMGSKLDPADDHDGDEADSVTKLMKAEIRSVALSKALEDVNGQVEKLVKRIEHLEKLPAPRKGALFAVDRGHEVQAGDEPVETVTKTVNLSSLRLSPEELRNIQGF